MTGKQHIMAGTTLTVLDAAVYFNIVNNWANESVVSCIESVGKFAFPHTTLLHPFTIGMLAISIVLLYLGFLLPDCDNSRSFIGRYFHVPVEHRTWMHTLYIVLLLGGIGIFFRPVIWLAFGYFQHLVCDAPSKCGVCWLNPYGYKRFGHAKIKKGHFLYLYSSEPGGWMVCGGLVVLTAAYILGVFGIGPFGDAVHTMDSTLQAVIDGIYGLVTYVL
jgi:membrane-bound metal-dependent hydrolase YbcI (DUF457 family)